MTAVQPLLVLVTGPPASGKTTISNELGRLLDIPVFHKDEIKERLAGDIPGSSLDWSQRLGRAAYRQLYHIGEVLLGAGRSCMLEANFHPELSLPDLLPLAERSDLVQIICMGDPDLLMERYLSRHRFGERHQVHLDDDPGRLEKLTADFRLDHQLALDGLTIVCDTTASQPVEARRLVEQISAWMNSTG